MVVLALAYLAWWLGEWQFNRLEDRRSSNTVVERNEKAAPVPVEDVLAVGEPVQAADEYRRITATGTYAADKTVIIRYRTRDSAPGVDVVVPLMTTDGTALLVDRGWLMTENAGRTDVDEPAPPSGEVTITGWVRADGSGASTKVSNQSARAISSEAIGSALDLTVYGGFVDLDTEDPEPEQPLEKAELPDLGEGPHFFYGLQWWFFGLLAVVGFVYLAFDEWRGGPEKRQRERTAPPSTGTKAPVTNEAAGDSRKAPSRPNSSGRP